MVACERWLRQLVIRSTLLGNFSPECGAAHTNLTRASRSASLSTSRLHMLPSDTSDNTAAKEVKLAVANLEDSSWGVRKAAVEALGKLDAAAHADAIVAKLAASGSAPLCLCSNLGARGVALRTVGGVDATAVAMRSITQNTDVDLLRRTGGGVSAWWNESGERATLCVTGLDPDRFPSKEHLQGLVEAEFERWGLTPEFW